MPKQNRPLVRDGRLQAPKKRTDRSYLRPAQMDAAAEELPLPHDPQVDFAAEAEAPSAAARVSVASSAVARPGAPARVPSNVRAIQHLGVRKRGEIDLAELARRDTEYAWHELRRIAVLATLVIITMIVLTVVLR